LGGDLVGTDAGVGLVERLDEEVDPGAEDLASAAVLAEAIEGGERVRRNVGAEPSNRVAVVIVVRRLDENQMKSLALHSTAHRGNSPRHIRVRLHSSACHRLTASPQSQCAEWLCNATALEGKLQHLVGHMATSYRGKARIATH